MASNIYPLIFERVISHKHICVFYMFWSPDCVACPIMRCWGFYNPDSNLRQRILQSYYWGARAHYLSPTARYACQWQKTISYTDYSTTETNTTENEQSTDKRGKNSSACGTFSYLACDTREIVFTWQNTLIIDHYPVAWESTTNRWPNTYIFPFQKFLMILKAQVWTTGLIKKDTKVSDWTLIPCCDTSIFQILTMTLLSLASALSTGLYSWWYWATFMDDSLLQTIFINLSMMLYSLRITKNAVNHTRIPISLLLLDSHFSLLW